MKINLSHLLSTVQIKNLGIILLPPSSPSSYTIHYQVSFIQNTSWIHQHLSTTSTTSVQTDLRYHSSLTDLAAPTYFPPQIQSPEHSNHAILYSIFTAILQSNHAILYSIFTAILQGSYYYYSHCPNKKNQKA